MGRWNCGDGTTRHSSPSGNVTSSRSRRKLRARSVPSAYGRAWPPASGVVAVQLLEHGGPVLGPGQSTRELAQLGGEPLVLVPAALAKLARIERDVLLVPEKPAVAGLAEGEVAGGAAPEVLEERGESSKAAPATEPASARAARRPGSRASAGRSART